MLFRSGDLYFPGIYRLRYPENPGLSSGVCTESANGKKGIYLFSPAALSGFYQSVYPSIQQIYTDGAKDIFHWEERTNNTDNVSSSLGAYIEMGEDTE